MGLYLGPLLQAVRWDQIKGCKPLIEDWLCDMCTVHAVKSNFQMCEATLMGLYVLYQHIKNLSVELVSPKKKNCAKQRSTEQELLLGRWSGRVCGNVERLLVKVDGRKLWELACVVWISYLRSGDEYLRGRGLSVEVAMEVAMESGQTACLPTLHRNLLVSSGYPKRGIYPSEAAGCEDKESLIQGTR